MGRRRSLAAFWMMAVVMSAVNPASAETIELVTYYPAPQTADMHTRSLTVGTQYANESLLDGQVLVYSWLGVGPGLTAAVRPSGPSPTEPLWVVGNILALGSTVGGANALFVADRAANDRLNGLRLRTNNTSQWTIGSRNNGTEHLQIFSDADNATRMLIEQGTGNVGIGTTAPIGRLDVAQDYTGANPTAEPQVIVRGQTDGNRQLQLGYNTTGNYGRIQATQQGTGVRPLILQEAGGNVGIGLNNPTEQLHVAGNARINGAFNGANGVFIDNLFVGDCSPQPGGGWVNTTTSWEDVGLSKKTITLPAGIAVITYSLAGYAANGIVAGVAGAWKVKVVIGSSESPEQSFFTNVSSHHTGMSGSWVTSVTGGPTTIKLQLRNWGWPWPGTTFYMNAGDYVIWTIVVYKS